MGNSRTHTETEHTKTMENTRLKTLAAKFPSRRKMDTFGGFKHFRACLDEEKNRTRLSEGNNRARLRD